MRWKSAILAALFLLFLAAFWGEIQRRDLQSQIGGHVISAFVCFALLLAGEWFFGFGLGDLLLQFLSGDQPRIRVLRVLALAIFVIPYFAFATPRGAFEFRYAVGMTLLPVLCVAVIDFSSRASDSFGRTSPCCWHWP